VRGAHVLNEAEPGEQMTELRVSDDELGRLQERHPRFHERGYQFVLEALTLVTQALDEPRHLTPREVAEGVRKLALDRFGPMARTVLGYWGIRDTEDVGRVVFAMIEQGILTAHETDRREDFADAFDFEEAFEQNYPWGE
jgi:uncharacterized repeat protein (TIGR04138 family)